MPRAPHNPGQWPRIMRAETAAAYLDEVSVEAFLRRVGSDYPAARNISGRGRVWLKSDLDAAIDAMAAGRPGWTGRSQEPARDAADVL